MFAYEWHAATGVMVPSRESLQLLGKDEPRQTSGRQRFANCHSDDRAGRFKAEKYEFPYCF
jgi:hypothetical protein